MENLNLENLKVGDKVVTLICDKDGYRYGSLYIVKEWSDLHKKWRYSRPSTPEKDAGVFPISGEVRKYKSDKINHYFSANPVHIQDVMKREAERVLRIAVEKEKSEIEMTAFTMELKTLMNKYNATIEPVQTCGDDQGVEMALSITIKNLSLEVHIL